MEKALVVLSLVLILCGCGSSVSQEEYDRIVAENEEMAAQIEELNREIETLRQLESAEVFNDELFDAFSRRMDSDYRGLEAYNHLTEVLVGEDVSEYYVPVYEAYRESLDNLVEKYGKEAAYYRFSEARAGWEEMVEELYGAFGNIDDKSMQNQALSYLMSLY